MVTELERKLKAITGQITDITRKLLYSKRHAFKLWKEEAFQYLRSHIFVHHLKLIHNILGFWLGYASTLSLENDLSENNNVHILSSYQLHKFWRQIA